MPARTAVSSMMPVVLGGFFLALLVPCCTSGYVTRVCSDGMKKASIAYKERYEEEVVEEEYRCSRSRAGSYKKAGGRTDEIVNCDHFRDHIGAVTDEAEEDEWYDSGDPYIGGLSATSRHDGAEKERRSAPRRYRMNNVGSKSVGWLL